MVLKILHLLFCFTALFVSGTTQDGGAAKSRPGDIATKVCDKLKEGLHSSTARLKRLAEGLPPVSEPQRANLKEFRHLALLGYNNETDDWVCEGSLISDRYVLTAAQCVNSRIAVTHVRLGDLDFKTDDDNSQYQEIGVSEVIRHPEYSTKPVKNDIALLKLENVAVLNDFVGPACLYTQQEISVGDDKLEVVGWGKLDFVERNSRLLKSVAELVSYQSCNSSYSMYDSVLIRVDDEKQICVGGRAGRCAIAGSPLQIDKDLGNVTLSAVVGIASFGPSCLSNFTVPTLYTRISNYIGWIEENVWNDNA